MSNRVTLTATTFINKNGEKSFGYRMYDNEGQSYNNTLTEEQFQLDDVDFLNCILYNSFFDNAAQDMFEYVKDCEMGMLINDNWYDWEEIKDHFDNI